MFSSVWEVQESSKVFSHTSNNLVILYEKLSTKAFWTTHELHTNISWTLSGMQPRKMPKGWWRYSVLCFQAAEVEHCPQDHNIWTTVVKQANVLDNSGLLSNEEENVRNTSKSAPSQVLEHPYLLLRRINIFREIWRRELSLQLLLPEYMTPSLGISFEETLITRDYHLP